MHYYTREAEPRFFVPNKSKPGELRPTTLRDAKKEKLVPSVTTILNILDKPALLNWKVEQHLKQAFEAVRAGDVSVSEYGADIDAFIKAIKQRTAEELDKAPQAGTDFHDLMEKYWLKSELPEADLKLCEKVGEAIKDKIGQDADFFPEEKFASPIGFGGMVDLKTQPFPLSSDATWVMDYKTKETLDKWKPGKMAYADHVRQLAAYRMGLGAPNARCANVFVCLESGDIEIVEHSQEDLEKGFLTFLDCLNIWQRENYPSGW